MTPGRRIVRLWAPVAFQLRVHWRGAAVMVALGALTLALLFPARGLAGPGPDGAAVLALPRIPSAGPALEWTTTARSPSQTQAASLAGLLSLLAGLAWIGFGVAAVSIFAVSAGAARERALDTGIRRATGASLRGIIASLILETGVLAMLALVAGVAIGSALLALARSWWPGVAAAVGALDPAASLALAAGLGAAALSSLHLVRPQDLLHPPSLDVGLGVPTYQVGISIALLLGAAALLGGSSGSAIAARASISAAPVYRVDAGDATVSERAERYGSLLRRLGTRPGITAASLTSAGASLGLGTSGAVTTDCGLCYFGMILIKWPGFTATVHSVSTDSFRTLSIPLLEGRGFEPGDRHGATRVAIVNRHLAMRYFQGGDAIGRDIYLAAGWPTTPYRVVGIVDDDRATVIGGAMQPREAVYLSVLQHPPRHAELVLQGDDGAPPAPAALAIERLGTVADLRRPQDEATRWVGGSLAVAALLILGLALIGTFATARRWADAMSWELALRRAVGASRKRVVWQIMRRTMSIGLFGAVLGLFFYAVVVAPAITGALPDLPLVRAGLMARAALLPVLLALVVAVVPGIRVTGRPPSQVLR